MQCWFGSLKHEYCFGGLVIWGGPRRDTSRDSEYMKQDPQRKVQVEARCGSPYPGDLRNRPAIQFRDQVSDKRSGAKDQVVKQERSEIGDVIGVVGRNLEMLIF